MPNLSRLVWHGEKARAAWAPFLSSYAHQWEEAEMTSVADGQRDAAVANFSPVEYMAFLPWALERKLKVRVLRETAALDLFSHVTEPGEGNLVVGVARYESDLETIDRNLGYPLCCVEAHWTRNVDPMAEWAGVHATADPFCNPLLRYVGLRLCPHIPCSPHCQESSKLGRALAGYLDQGVVARVVELLSDVTWDSYRGTAIVTARPFRIILGTVPLDERVVVRMKGAAHGAR